MGCLVDSISLAPVYEIQVTAHFSRGRSAQSAVLQNREREREEVRPAQLVGEQKQNNNLSRMYVRCGVSRRNPKGGGGRSTGQESAYL